MAGGGGGTSKEGGDRISLWAEGRGGGYVQALDRLNIDTVNEKRRESINGFENHRWRLVCPARLVGRRRLEKEKR